jgi:Tetratricopeptide repeat.
MECKTQHAIRNNITGLIRSSKKIYKFIEIEKYMQRFFKSSSNFIKVFLQNNKTWRLKNTRLKPNLISLQFSEVVFTQWISKTLLIGMTTYFLMKNASIVIMSDHSIDMSLQELKNALKATIQFKGDRSKEAGQLFHKIGYILIQHGKAQESLKFLGKALIAMQISEGKESLAYASVLADISVAFLHTQQPRKAINGLKHVLTLRKKHLGEEHVDIASCYVNLAGAYMQLDEYFEASVQLEQAYQIFCKLEGPESQSATSVLYNLGMTYKTLGSYAKAINCLTEAHKIYEKLYGPGHPLTIKTSNELKWLQGRKNIY